MPKRFTRTHGLSHHPTYRVWLGIRARCCNPDHPAFPSYGGRGITLCDKWQDVGAFIADVGVKPSARHEIDRIDNDRGYEPGNVRWVTRSRNDRNRRNNLWVTFRGERRLLIELCEERGLRFDTVKYRLTTGWTVEAALGVHVRPKAPNGTRPPPRWHCRRLTIDERREIHRLYAAGGTSHAKLAAQFGVKPTIIGTIVKDPRWE